MVIEVRQYKTNEPLCVKFEGQCNHYATDTDKLGTKCLGCGSEQDIDGKFMVAGDYIRKEEV